jgi:hypothetical protein
LMASQQLRSSVFLLLKRATDYTDRRETLMPP